MPSPDELMRQAKQTAREYMLSAVYNIDEKFGKGFAEKNPALVAAYMQTAAADFSAVFLTQTIAESLDGIAGRIDAVADQLNKNGVL